MSKTLKETFNFIITILLDMQKEWYNQFHYKNVRSLHLTSVGCVGSFFSGISKLLLGILSLSFFTCVNALYTLGIVGGKVCALVGIRNSKTKQEQLCYYRLIGFFLLGISFLYIIYSIRLLFYPTTSEYHQYVALGISTIVFTEVVMNIKSVIVEQHNKSLLFHAIKKINLSSSMINLVLVQEAILSFTEKSMPQYYNGFVGIMMGIFANIVGISMFFRLHRIKHNKDYNLPKKLLKKIIKREKLDIKFKPLRYIDYDDGSSKFTIELKNFKHSRDIKYLKYIAKHDLNMEVLEK